MEGFNFVHPLFVTVKTFFRAFLITFGVIMFISGIFALGYFARDLVDGEQSFSLLDEAHQIILENGFKEPPPAPALEYGMIHGMVSAYGDPHTMFIEPPQHELQSDSLEGKFGGIGVQLGTDADGYHVIFPFPSSPASNAGIQEGDRLLFVDGVAITPQTPIDQVQSLIRGKVGKLVRLTIARPPDYTELEFRLRREEFPLPSVTWHLDAVEPRIGVVKVNLVAASTPEEIENAVEDLQSRGATHFVLDLRDNPGGLLTAGVDIARLFLEEGIIMQQQYRGEEVETYEVKEPGPLVNIPLTVLINHGSASAAEIAAGALQLHKRATLIGSPSFGKDSIQLVFELQDHSSLRVTSAHWWIPGLEPPIASAGLQPDISVADSEDPNTDMVMQAAIQSLLAYR